MKTKNVAKVNNVDITVIDGVEKLVPIKPICEALGIDHKGQVDKIKDDEILSSVGGLSSSKGSDGKNYEMFCVPYMYIFGWLFTINPKNVKAEARENVIKYKQKCCTVLFKYFSEQSEFLEQKQIALKRQLEVVEQIQNDYDNHVKLLFESEYKLIKVKEITFKEWQNNNRQL